MKIAILTSGILPVPAVQGGAVENLVDFYLEYNDKHRLHDITVYSVWHADVEKHPAQQSEVNHYIYIKMDGWWNKLRKKFYQKTHGKEYYHYTIEFFLHKAIKDIRKQQYDVIILENRPGYALKLKELTDAKLIYHLHNEKLDKKAAHAQKIYDAATLILTVSDYIKKCVQTINNQDCKTKTIYNGINLAVFSNNAPKNRSAIGFHGEDFVLVFSGRINREKGIMELVEAMNLLKEYQHIRLMIIGSTFYGNATNENEFTKELKAKAEFLQERIKFTGFIPYSYIPDYLRMSDVAVIPSVWEEPFGNTVVEAMAAGLPLITTRSGGIPEICEGVATIVDRENIVENLAAAILDLYNHPEKREQMAAAGLERAKLFDKETYAKNFFKALEGI